MSSELQIMLLAMTPINELRGTIPLAVSVFGFSPFSAFFWSVLGNMLPVFFLLWFWKKAAIPLAQKIKVFNKFLNWLFSRTQKRFYLKYRRWGDIGLIFFVAVPLPFTGAWTGTVAAAIFGIRYLKALGLIFIGVLIAGIIVTLLTSGFASLGDRLFF